MRSALPRAGRSRCRRKPGLSKYAGIVERVVLQARAEEAVDAALQAHAALGLELAELPVVAQELAEYRDLAVAGSRPSRARSPRVAHALDLLRVDGGGIRLRHRATRGSQRERQRREAERHQRPELFSRMLEFLE
jgi:hypothetical protein